MWFHIFRLPSVLGAVLLVSACMPLWMPASDQSVAMVNWHERRLLLTERPYWRVDGRMAMQTDEDTWSAFVAWVQVGKLYEIGFFGPLGGHRLRVEGGDDYIILTMSGGRKFTGRSAQRLIEHETGWVMPVDKLRYWVRGMSAPGDNGQEFFNDQGYLQKLQQSGWVIRYQGYQLLDDIPMPRKVRLENKQLKIKFSIHDWYFDYPGKDA